MRACAPLLLLALTSCARYAAHDPNSYCMQREAELRLRPATDCENPTNSHKPQCDWAMTLELHWKCKRWSSW